MEAEAKVADAPRGRRGQLKKRVRGETAKLERLAERDHDLTGLLAEYQREHGEITSVADFIVWIKDQGALPMIEERAIRSRLERDYGVVGERGRKPGNLVARFNDFERN